MYPTLPLRAEEPRKLGPMTSHFDGSLFSFYKLAITGEQAVRFVATNPDETKIAGYVHDYEEALRNLTPNWNGRRLLDCLFMTVQSVAVAIQQLAMHDTPILSAREIVETIDGILYIAIALERVGLVDAESVHEVASLVDAMFTSYEDYVPYIRIYAEPHYEKFRDHPDYEQIFNWPLGF